MLVPWGKKGRQSSRGTNRKRSKASKFKIDPAKQSFLAVTQMTVAGAVFDIAGRKNPNKLFSKNLDILLKRPELCGLLPNPKKTKLEEICLFSLIS
jgi:hypothetical protein